MPAYMHIQALSYTHAHARTHTCTCICARMRTCPHARRVRALVHRHVLSLTRGREPNHAFTPASARTPMSTYARMHAHKTQAHARMRVHRRNAPACMCMHSCSRSLHTHAGPRTCAPTYTQCVRPRASIHTQTFAACWQIGAILLSCNV
jgi:hypothetical protein